MNNPPNTSGWKAHLGQLPVLGTLLRWANNHLRLNARLFELNRQLEELRAVDAQVQRDALQRDHALKSLAESQHKTLHERIDAVQRLIDSLAGRIEQGDLDLANRLTRLEALDIGQRLHIFDSIDIANRLARAEQLGHERDSRVASLLQAFAERPAPVASAAGLPPAAAADADQAIAGMDRFYLEFENAFRGAPDDIRERLKVYLPYLRPIAGDAGALVVDVGCGRGEWLQLLKEEGIQAKGIDLNASMVAECHARGLSAEAGDAIRWLGEQEKGSLAAITAFHVIEHLPFDVLLAFFDTALRALRPGGLLICETPNPENLVVAAQHFYYDPTHRNPLVPAVIEFTARQRGFTSAEILRLHPYPDSFLLPEDSELARRFNRAFYSAQDYALLGRK